LQPFGTGRWFAEGPPLLGFSARPSKPQRTFYQGLLAERVV
jgi:hypothetical protein